MRLEEINRNAVVSGGTKGLGLAIVKYLITNGWKVHTFSRELTPPIAKLIEEEKVLWDQVDASDIGNMQEYCNNKKTEFSNVSLLVNNMGNLKNSLFITSKFDDILKTTNINFISPMILTQTCARFMSAKSYGKIINISTINTVRGYKGVATYAAAKSAMDSLARSLARELGPAGITINNVVPGYFDSDMTSFVSQENRNKIKQRTPLSRFGKEEDILNAIRYLIEDNYLFMTGQSLIIDGGITC